MRREWEKRAIEFVEAGSLTTASTRFESELCLQIALLKQVGRIDPADYEARARSTSRITSETSPALISSISLSIADPHVRVPGRYSLEANVTRTLLAHGHDRSRVDSSELTVHSQ